MEQVREALKNPNVFVQIPVNWLAGLRFAAGFNFSGSIRAVDQWMLEPALAVARLPGGVADHVDRKVRPGGEIR